MELLADLTRFKHRQNIVLQGFDPVSAGGFTQVPNCVLRNKELSFAAKVVYSMLLSYAWHQDKVFPGQETMADELGTSRPTVTKAVGELQQAGLLDVDRRGQGQTNIYVLRHTVKLNGKK